MILLATNRTPKADGFSNDRNPSGNTWWICPGKPLDQFSRWRAIAKDSAVMAVQDQKKPVVLFVHGYNESWQRDMDVSQAIFDGLGLDFTLIPFSWFSRGSVFDYFGDRQRAQKSAADLLEVLKALDCPNVIAHSMGNYLLQLSLALVNGTTEALINHLAMVAADVPQDVLLPSQSNIAQVCNSGVVMWSPADAALEGSSIIHGKLRLGALGPMGD